MHHEFPIRRDTTSSAANITARWEVLAAGVSSWRRD